MAFVDTEQPSDESKNAWIERIGLYWYYSLTLADFDPNRALEIYDNPAHIIAEAVVTRRCAEYVKPKK